MAAIVRSDISKKPCCRCIVINAPWRYWVIVSVCPERTELLAIFCISRCKFAPFPSGIAVAVITVMDGLVAGAIVHDPPKALLVAERVQISLSGFRCFSVQSAVIETPVKLISPPL